MTVCSYRLDSLWQIVNFYFGLGMSILIYHNAQLFQLAEKITRKKSGKYSMVFGIQANFKDTRQ
jgi:hypothetical protein